MLRGRLAQHPRHLIPARSRLPHPEQVDLFVRNVEKEFGSVTRVADLEAVPGAVADYLAAQNLPGSLVMAPHPELREIPWSARPLLDIREGRAQGTDAVSVQHGFAGIAETGTLMLPSSPERPVTLNLLADTEIAVLRASAIVGAYEEAWDRLRAELGGMPRNVMLVTGPSRSADIEQTLELGAHGPRRLHIVLVEDSGEQVEGNPTAGTKRRGRSCADRKQSCHLGGHKQNGQLGGWFASGRRRRCGINSSNALAKANAAPTRSLCRYPPSAFTAKPNSGGHAMPPPNRIAVPRPVASILRVPPSAAYSA